MNGMDRRQLLEAAAALIGLAALPGTALSASPVKPPALDHIGILLLAAIADTMIPRTGTPGAIQAGVPAAFHNLLRDWANPAHRKALIEVMDDIDAAAVKTTGKPFALLASKQRTAALAAFDASNFKPGSDYARFKDLLCTLYYFSKPGATVELRYEHAPGAWEPSIPLTAATRTWAGAAG